MFHSLCWITFWNHYLEHPAVSSALQDLEAKRARTASSGMPRTEIQKGAYILQKVLGSCGAPVSGRLPEVIMPAPVLVTV